MIPPKTHNLKKGIALALATMMSVSGATVFAQQKSKPVDPISKKVETLLAKMTLDEKIGQQSD